MMFRSALMPLSVLTLSVSGLAAPSAATAQDASYYRCDYKTIRMNIPSLPLKQALALFTKATRCPVSVDVHETDDLDPAEITTTVLRGRFPPDEALKRMMWNTPFKSAPVRGGFSIKMANDE